jgi:hypothetical protein
MSNPSPKNDTTPSRLWGLILFGYVGISLIITTPTVESGYGIDPALVFLLFGVASVLCGIGYFLRMSWAGKAITITLLSAIFTVSGVRLVDLFWPEGV